VRLQRGYSKYSNPYHNLVHAADVAQTIHYLITRSGLSVGGRRYRQWLHARLRFDFDSTPVRLQFDRTSAIRRPMLRPHLCVGCCMQCGLNNYNKMILCIICSSSPKVQ